ncbi:hypothetical protein PAF17_10585 [Paracoccus sp. Z330]|uniref:DUF4038 domain-containing protein n=1 Tax=Paracoccus onchidii TaxID=3017813 RepID=A0ABT4ZFR5_9RHOB|nr:hypothetical protein [Paracoccus onchidii]MDB6177947.1 hypothetical protein [Paracoccus onchidii]
MPKLDLLNATAIKVAGGNALALKGVGFSWSPPPATPNMGVGTDTPMMIAGGSYPVGLAYNWWGGSDGDQQGNTGHGILADTRGDYTGAVTSSALGETLPGVGLAMQVGPANNSQWLWNRYHGEWGDYCDPRNDMPLFSGGAFLMYEGEQMLHEDWVAREYTGVFAQPYIWRSNGHRITLARDLDYEYRLFELAAQNGVTPYIGGNWPPMVILPIDDAAWRGRFDGYDIALRYRREYLSAQLAANSLPSDVWIVPTHWIYARAYDDDQAGNLPAGIASHLDFHALENGYSAENRGHHPYMPSKLAIYCARAMIYDVVEGQDALALPDNASEGITGTVASYLRQMAADIVSDYAPAGRGGSSYSEPALLTATAQAPELALGDWVGSYVSGGSAMTNASSNGVRYLAAIANFDNADSHVVNSETELVHLYGPDSDHMVLKVSRPDWHNSGNTTILWGEVWDSTGAGQGFAMVDAPTSGDWLVEIWVDDGQVRFRKVDLNASWDSADKVTYQQYGGGSDPTPSAADSFTVNDGQTYYLIHAAWAAEAPPSSQGFVDLNAWIDGLNPSWVAWE